MTANIAIGLLLTAATVFVHSAGLVVLTELMRRFSSGLPSNAALLGASTLTVMCSGLCVLIGVEIALWAAAFVWLEVLPDFESSLYFSISTFTTIGFGDIMPEYQWRLFAAIEGLAGFLIIGWSSAYLVAAGIRFGPFERDKHF